MTDYDQGRNDFAAGIAYLLHQHGHATGNAPTNVQNTISTVLQEHHKLARCNHCGGGRARGPCKDQACLTTHRHPEVV